MALCFSYSRVSTSSQAGDDKDGLRRQKRSLEVWLKNNPDYTLDTTITDAGVSAYKGNNLKEQSGLGAFLALVQLGRVPTGSALLIEELSRLTRRPFEESFPLIQGILFAGVDIIILENGQKLTKSLTSDLGQFITVSVQLFSNFKDADERQRKVSEAWKQKREKAAAENKPMSAMCPSWLQLKEDRSGYTVIEAKARIVRDIFNRRYAGASMQQIVKELNNEGVPVLHNRKYQDGKGYIWTQAGMKTLLTSKSVIGTLEASRYHSDDVDKPLFYPPIIPTEIFNAVQLLRIPGKGIGKRDFAYAVNILRGVLYCPECQRAYMNNGLREKPLFRGSLTCRTYKANACSMPTMPYGIVEDALTQRLFYQLEKIDTDSTHAEDINHMKNQIDVLNKKVNNARANLDDALDDAERKDFMSQWRNLKAERDALHRDIEKKQTLLRGASQNTLADVDLTTKEGRTEAQVIIRRVIERVTVDTKTRLADIILTNGNMIKNFDLMSEDKSAVIEIVKDGGFAEEYSTLNQFLGVGATIIDLADTEKHSG